MQQIFEKPNTKTKYQTKYLVFVWSNFKYLVFGQIFWLDQNQIVRMACKQQVLAHF
jgi:hypothetical protein